MQLALKLMWHDLIEKCNVVNNESKRTIDILHYLYSLDTPYSSYLFEHNLESSQSQYKILEELGERLESYNQNLLKNDVSFLKFRYDTLRCLEDIVENIRILQRSIAQRLESLPPLLAHLPPLFRRHEGTRAIIAFQCIVRDIFNQLIEMLSNKPVRNFLRRLELEEVEIIIDWDHISAEKVFLIPKNKGRKIVKILTSHWTIDMPRYIPNFIHEISIKFLRMNKHKILQDKRNARSSNAINSIREVLLIGVPPQLAEELFFKVVADVLSLYSCGPSYLFSLLCTDECMVRTKVHAQINGFWDVRIKALLNIIDNIIEFEDNFPVCYKKGINSIKKLLEEYEYFIRQGGDRSYPDSKIDGEFKTYITNIITGIITSFMEKEVLPAIKDFEQIWIYESKELAVDTDWKSEIGVESCKIKDCHCRICSSRSPNKGNRVVHIPNIIWACTLEKIVNQLENEEKNGEIQNEERCEQNLDIRNNFLNSIGVRSGRICHHLLRKEGFEREGVKLYNNTIGVVMYHIPWHIVYSNYQNQSMESIEQVAYNNIENDRKYGFVNNGRTGFFSCIGPYDYIGFIHEYTCKAKYREYFEGRGTQSSLRIPYLSYLRVYQQIKEIPGISFEARDFSNVIRTTRNMILLQFKLHDPHGYGCETTFKPESDYATTISKFIETISSQYNFGNNFYLFRPFGWEDIMIIMLDVDSLNIIEKVKKDFLDRMNDIVWSMTTVCYNGNKKSETHSKLCLGNAELVSYIKFKDYEYTDGMVWNLKSKGHRVARTTGRFDLSIRWCKNKKTLEDINEELKDILKIYGRKIIHINSLISFP